jgi:hypothetical protein
MNCKICGGAMIEVFAHQVLRKHNVQYFRCSSCDYLCTEEPYWLSEAYARPINISDTGLVSRNIDISNVVSVLLHLLFRRDGKYLDFAGGYGLFTRLMRDIGYDFYWSDPYTENLFAVGFEINDKDNFEAVTAFEVFEHLVNPIEEIKKMAALSSSIIFSTETFPAESVPEADWDYYGFTHGQHISFYSLRTLKWIATKLGLTLYPFDGVFLLTAKEISATRYQIAKFLSSYRLINQILFKRIVTSKTFSDHILLINR